MENEEKKSGSVTLALSYPIKWGDDEIKQLTLRRPKAKDIEHLPDKPTMKDLLKIAGRISAQPPSLIGELDATDALKVCEAVGDFLGGGLETGKTDLS